jgi:hypothetical protein
MRQKHIQKEKQKEEAKTKAFLESLAPMKLYPKKNPRAIEMLIEYTVYPDIKIYQVNPSLLARNEEVTGDFEKGELRNVRINTLISLSLECERILKYTYVKVDDVLKSLKETGTYEPPGMFFNFLGFLYFRIRQKPIIAENLLEHIKLGEKNITLFDLFFKYTTPILVANPDYYEFPVTHDIMRPELRSGNGPIWVGNVRVNHRTLNPYYINKPLKHINRCSLALKSEMKEHEFFHTWYNFYNMRRKGEVI